WDQVVRELILARSNGKEAQPAAWYLYERREQYQVIAEDVSQGIFGVQIQCAQCHNHPISPEIEQRHYWGLVAFFNRGQNVVTPDGPRMGEKAVGGFSQFADLQGQSSPNLLVYLQRDEVKDDRPTDGND